MRSPVMLIGEAPGAEEAEQGIPFVGRSGRLLNELMAETGIPRGLCYVTNTVAYRPPGNRTPHHFEITVSRPRLFAEIAAVQPMMIITLGATARKALRPNGAPVSVCHGFIESIADVLNEVPGMSGASVDWMRFKPFMMLPTYHPAAALRDRAILGSMRRDLSYLRQFAPGGDHGPDLKA